MVEFNPINNFRETVKPNTEKTAKQPAPLQFNAAPKTEVAKEALSVDMSGYEIQAAINKTLGINLSSKYGIDFEKINAAFAKDPVAFAQEHASPEVRKNAEFASAEFDAYGTVARTFTPERREQVIEGFSQRNESPRAFTDEFLDLFC